MIGYFHQQKMVAIDLLVLNVAFLEIHLTQHPWVTPTSTMRTGHKSLRIRSCIDSSTAERTNNIEITWNN